MARLPSVADRFYPGNPTALNLAVKDLLPSNNGQQLDAFAVISPHAGYVYSGAVAGRTLSSVAIPEVVILLGPNHHGQGAPISLSNTSWKMPFGDVPMETELVESLLQSSSVIKHDEIAHRYEHSLEVQVPILHKLQPKLSLVPLVISSISYPMCEDLAKILSGIITNSKKKILIVASSDMNHFESRTVTSKKDKLALDRIMDMDPQGLYNTVIDKKISMCGMIPATIALKTAILLGATQSNLVEYTDSGSISGDTDQVVGYAGVTIT